VIIVSNTGPLIGLAKVEQLEVLRRLAREVYIPPQVEIELLARRAPETGLLAAALKGLIQVKPPGTSSPNIESVLRPLDEGERQAVVLARSFAEPVLLLLDDRVGRIAARKLGQPLTGLAGLLLMAKQRGFVPAVVPLLLAVRKGGYWVADDVVEVVRKLASE